MTKKQMRKFALEIIKQNDIHDNASSEEERQKAEKRIFSITEQILSQPHGLEILDEIDNMIQQIFDKIEK